MRTSNVGTATVHTTGTVSFACPQPVTAVKGLLPMSAVAAVEVPRSEVPQWGATQLRPSARRRTEVSRITATGVGYGFSSDLGTGIAPSAAPGAERRTAADAAEQAGKRVNDSTARNARTTQRKQLHLMSRRDPQTWRPPV